MENYYEILEVSQNASPEVISKAYKTLSKKYHPDLNEEASEDKMIKINEAYETLKDPVLKEEYDKKLADFQQAEMIRKMNQTRSANTSKAQQSSYASQQQDAQYTAGATAPEYSNTSNSSDLDYQLELEERLLQEQQYQERLNNLKREYMKQAEDDYYNHLRQMGYTVVEPFSFKDFIRKVVTFVILYLSFALIYLIPSVHAFVRESLVGTSIGNMLYNLINYFLQFKYLGL